MNKIKFDDFLKMFIDSIKSYDFFVDWCKIDENLKDIEIQLNLLNYLIGKEDIENEFKELLKKYPEIIKVLPILIAVRDNELSIIDNNIITKKFSFKIPKKITEAELNKYCDFFAQTGLKNLFKEKKVKNLVDYVFGIEVGMDTNARKNRTGTAMENLIENYIKIISSQNEDIEYISQATQIKIFEKWNYKIETDKTNRRFDFAIYNKTNKKLFLIEVNFYGSQGSKLKATAGEYKSLEDFLSNQNIDLIWITDGVGWQSAKNALEETYIHNKYILNLNLVKEGILKEILLGTNE